MQAEGESPRTVDRQGHFDGFEPKTMYTIFFKSNCVVNVSYLDKGKTIDQYSYLSNCLKPLVTALNKQRRTRGSNFIMITQNLMLHKV